MFNFLQIIWHELKTRAIGEIGFTIGSQKTRQENTLEGALQSTARNTLASEQANVRIQAGNKAVASNIDVMVANDKKATISGKQGARIEAGKDVIDSTDKYEFSQSGLTIALSTPVTDAVQSARTSIQQAKATKNDKLKGVYAVKAAEDAVIAAQNAQKVADTLGQLGKGMEQNAAAAENPAVKISVSVGTQKQARESTSRTVTHAKSHLNAGNVDIVSDNGKVELEGVDAKVEETLLLDGKEGIVSKGVMDTYDNKTTNKNHSGSVGVFVGFNGDSYGIGIEASASVGKGKENSHTETWQNNQLQAGKFVTNSDKGKLTLDATNVKTDRWEADVQDLDLISRQDVTKYKSEQVQAGGSVSVTYGSGGGATFNAAYNSAKLNTAQVENQTSVDVGKGRLDVKVKGNTHLEGAVITSEADNANNHFQSGTLTTKEIENHSELQTKSATISGGSGGINPMSALSLLGNKNESSQSTTRSAVGENINLTLTDDPNAETTLKTLNRDTKNANEKVTKHDISKVKETEEIVKGIGEISDKAMQIYTHSEREKIEQAKLELGKEKQRAKERGVPAQQIDDDPQVQWAAKQLADEQKTYDKEYGTGSPTKRAVDAVTAALQGLAAKNTGQAIVGLASPYLNEQIKRHTLNADGSVNTKANLVAHALLGGIEAAVTGNNIAAGAAAGASGEAAAMFITNALYPNKKPSELTEVEKKNVTFLSQLAGGLAAGIVGDSTQAVALGGDIAKRAVENNYLSVQLAKEKADIQRRLNNPSIDRTEKEKLENRLAQINQIDIDKDIALEQACSNAPLSENCQTLMKEVKNYEFGYFGTSSQSGNYYGMPVYTRNNLLYGEDANKVAAYSKQYDLLRLRKEASLGEFAKYTGWDLNTVRSIYSATDTAQAIAAVYAGAYMTASGLGNQGKGVDFSKQVPNAVSGKEHQVTVGEIAGYKTIKVDFNKSQIKGSNEYQTVNNLRPNVNYELSNGTKFKTNNYGYVEEISYSPIDIKMPRDKRQTQVGKEGLSTDVGGHIQACSQGGTCDRYNLFPQDANFNNSAYKTYFENIISKALKEGKTVNVNTKFIRNDPSSSRPDKLEIQFSIDGIKQEKLKFNNEASKK